MLDVRRAQGPDPRRAVTVASCSRKDATSAINVASDVFTEASGGGAAGSPGASSLPAAVVAVSASSGTGNIYYRTKIAEGKTPREARRCLKRRLADHVWRTMIADEKRQRAKTSASVDAA